MATRDLSVSRIQVPHIKPQSITFNQAQDAAIARALAGQTETEEHSSKAKAASSSKSRKRRFVRLDSSDSDSDDEFNPEQHSQVTPSCKRVKRCRVQSAAVRTRAAAARDVGACLCDSGRCACIPEPECKQLETWISYLC